MFCSFLFSCCVVRREEISSELWLCARVPRARQPGLGHTRPRCRLRGLVECGLGAGCRGARTRGQSPEAQAEAWRVWRFKAGCALLLFWGEDSESDTVRSCWGS